MSIKELFSKAASGEIDNQQLVSYLKLGRNTASPDVDTYVAQLDPKGHDVFDKLKRKDKIVKIDVEDPNAMNTGEPSGKDGFKTEPVARVAIAIQKLIVKRAVSFLFGNAVKIDSDPENDNQKAVLEALNRIRYDVKEKSINRRVARTLFSSTEVAELWYPVDKPNSTYGFNSKFKLRCAIFSPLKGDKLYPYFDATGDMVAFSREYVVKAADNQSTTYFETYTDQFIYKFNVTEGGKLVEGFPKINPIGKIPIIYGHQDISEWNDVQNLIDRLEWLLSNFADINDYHANPKIVVKGELKGFAKKGDAGGILELDENADAKYLAWDHAPESVKLEIETLIKLIHTLTQTPDISFDSVKGIGAVSGIALKLMFMDAHLKVADHQEVFDEYLQRRYNVIKAFVGTFNTSLANDSEALMAEPIITPYMIVDEGAEMKIWVDANGGNAIMSQKASFEKAGLTRDPEKDFEQYQAEQNSANTFENSEPTI